MGSFCGMTTLREEGSGMVTLTFQPGFSGEPLVLGKQLYHSPSGDSLYLDVLRCYISSIRLQGKGQAAFSEPEMVHLIDAEAPERWTILLKNVPAGLYTSLQFKLGTDSLTNVSGAMGGDLDPTLGMYWAWNSGYINIKMEGRSNACPTARHTFEFHLGGYMPPHQTVRPITLPIKCRVKPQGNTNIQVDMDLASFFKQLHLANTHQIMIPGSQAAMLADDFAGVFHIHEPR